MHADDFDGCARWQTLWSACLPVLTINQDPSILVFLNRAGYLTGFPEDQAGTGTIMPIPEECLQPIFEEAEEDNRYQNKCRNLNPETKM